MNIRIDEITIFILACALIVSLSALGILASTEEDIIGETTSMYTVDIEIPETKKTGCPFLAKTSYGKEQEVQDA